MVLGSSHTFSRDKPWMSRVCINDKCWDAPKGTPQMVSQSPRKGATPESTQFHLFPVHPWWYQLWWVLVSMMEVVLQVLDSPCCSVLQVIQFVTILLIPDHWRPLPNPLKGHTSPSQKGHEELLGSPLRIISVEFAKKKHSIFNFDFDCGWQMGLKKLLTNGLTKG